MAQNDVELPEDEMQEQESQSPEEDKWMQGMEGKYPDLKGDREGMFRASREGYDKEHELNKENADAYNRISNAIQKSPESAEFINRLVNSDDDSDPVDMMIDIFGDDLSEVFGNGGNVEALKSKHKDTQAKRKAEDEKNQEIGQAYVDACEELGVEPEETERKIVAKFNGEDAQEFLANKEFFKAIIQSLSYEDDMLAAEARGRNAKMGERNRRGVTSDGLPRSTSAGGAEKQFDPNSLGAINERRRRMAD